MRINTTQLCYTFEKIVHKNSQTISIVLRANFNHRKVASDFLQEDANDLFIWIATCSDNDK